MSIRDIKNAGFLFFVGLMFAGIIATVNLITKDAIAANIEAKKARLFSELYEADRFEPLEGLELPEKIVEISGAYICINDPCDTETFVKEDYNLVAIIYQFNATGYGGKMDVLLAIDINTNLVSGLSVLKHAETPGFGADLLDQPSEFKNQFVGMSIFAPQVDVTAGVTKTTKGIKTGLEVVYDHYESEYGD